MNVQEKVRLIKEGRLNSVDLCRECLDRIQANDQQGRKLNAVTVICPDWHEQAKALDDAENKENSKGLLYGIPVLLKDNIEIRGMANTAGSYVLRDLIAEEDSYLVKKLREEGAVILGKCNLSEFAYWMSEDNMPCGYSSLSGQVVHPYNPAFDPSGSSSGSAVAVAARYCDVTVGTETDGSLMSPAIANAIVSIKPSTGLISRNGILPLSAIQDTPGPMGNSVEDCAVLLQAMSGIDEFDSLSRDIIINDYLNELKEDLHGKKIGVFTVKGYDHDAESLDLLKQIITDNGGEVYEFEFEEAQVDEYGCLFYEFKNGINNYLKDKKCHPPPPKDIIRMNEEEAERCLRYGQSLLIKSEECSGSLEDEEYLAKRRSVDEKAHRLLDSTIDKNDLSSVVTVCSSVPANLAAVTGACSMTIPARVFNEREYAPSSFYMMAKRNKEGELIRLAYTLEQSLHLNCAPSWLEENREN